MLNFIKSIFKNPASASESPGESVDYKGFKITPCSKQVSGGWSTEATIEKKVGETMKSHHLIRADMSSDKNSANDLAVLKSKTMIDQRGEGIFD